MNVWKDSVKIYLENQYACMLYDNWPNSASFSLDNIDCQSKNAKKNPFKYLKIVPTSNVQLNYSIEWNSITTETRLTKQNNGFRKRMFPFFFVL